MYECPSVASREFKDFPSKKNHHDLYDFIDS